MVLSLLFKCVPDNRHPLLFLSSKLTILQVDTVSRKCYHTVVDTVSTQYKNKYLSIHEIEYHCII